MRRTALLLVLVALGAVLVVLIEPPRRRTGAERSRGPHVFRTTAESVRRFDVALGDRRFSAERSPDGWQLDGRPASSRGADALDDLAKLAASLRAVDAFRPAEVASFGLEPPSGAVVVTTRAGTQRLVLGALNASGGTLYARRDRHRRVLQVGIYLLSALERVFGARESTAA